MTKREILYIEDNFHNRRIVRKILEREGYALFECEDGLEGYEMLRAMKPGIVLLDISLPSMDGMEIAGKVKADPELKHIYLIALTASAMQGDRERFLAGGCDDYMSKPFRALDLVEMINRYDALIEQGSPAPDHHEVELAAPSAEEIAETAEPSQVVKVDLPLPPAESTTEHADAEKLEDEKPAVEPEAAPSVEELPEAEAEPQPEALEEPAAPEAEAETDIKTEPAEAPEAEIEPEAEQPPAVEVTAESEVEPQLPEETPELLESEEAAVPESAPETTAEVEPEPVTPEPEAELEPVADLPEEVVAEIMSDKLADTAELRLDTASQEDSAWGLVTETVEMQQTEAQLADEESAPEEQALAEPEAAEQLEEEPSEVESEAESLAEALRGKNSTDLLKAEVMSMINSETLKPADPN